MSEAAEIVYPEFDYTFATVNDLAVKVDSDGDRPRVTAVTVDGEDILPTDRFWTSLFARFGFSNSFFKYFSHAEVFDRISQVRTDDRMRLCIERGVRGPRLLAVSAPTAAVAKLDDLREISEQYQGSNIAYSNGIFESTHVPAAGGGNTVIGGDEFSNRFVLSCPVDGYGKPSTYLSMLRTVCSNGLVAYTKMFRQEISTGKNNDNVTPSLLRVLEGFGNDEGFSAIRDRIEAAQASRASVHEAMQLEQLLLRSVGGTVANTDESAIRQVPILSKLIGLTGNICGMYGIANPDAMSVRRQRLSPVRCTVYDLINFATEVATHHMKPEPARKLQAWVGNVIGADYDLEGTESAMKEFADLHLTA